MSFTLFLIYDTCRLFSNFSSSQQLFPELVAGDIVTIKLSTVIQNFQSLKKSIWENPLSGFEMHVTV